MKTLAGWFIAGLLAVLVVGAGWHVSTLQAGMSKVQAGRISVGLPIQPAAGKGASNRPVVVELFTSQGCSSCPPADRLLGELADHPDIIALAHHVDYWDYIGWKDPFARPEATERQREYSQTLGLRFIYTPQMVIDGHKDVVGSRRGEIIQTIEAARSEVRDLEVVIAETEEGVKVSIAGGVAPSQGATVWLAVYDSEHRTRVERGENSGRNLIDANVVRGFVELGTWRGEAVEFVVDSEIIASEVAGGCAVLVQEGRVGRILGAARMETGETRS